MIKSIIILIFVFAIVMLWLRHFEWSNIFFPSRDFSVLPEAFEIKYDDVFFKTRDGVRINGWFIPSRNDSPGNYTVLLCHGNGGNISDRISKIVVLNQIGLDVFIFDYRGYGISNGRASEAGIYLDTEAAYKYLIEAKKILPENIIVYGESLGGVVAVDLASKVKIKALILEGVFTHAKDMAREIFPFLPTFLIRSKLDSLGNIGNINIPKLFIHSSNDEIVPIELSKKLFNAAAEPKTYATLEGGHNTLYMDSPVKFRDSISSFIDKIN